MKFESVSCDKKDKIEITTLLINEKSEESEGKQLFSSILYFILPACYILYYSKQFHSTAYRMKTSQQLNQRSS